MIDTPCHRIPQFVSVTAIYKRMELQYHFFKQGTRHPFFPFAGKAPSISQVPIRMSHALTTLTISANLETRQVYLIYRNRSFVCDNLIFVRLRFYTRADTFQIVGIHHEK